MDNSAVWTPTIGVIPAVGVRPRLTDAILMWRGSGGKGQVQDPK